MKYAKTTVLALAVLLNSAALSQHGHGMGGGSSMGGSSMSHGANASSHGSGGSTGSTQKPTLNDQLTKNTTIAGKIQKLTGMSAQQACQGFKNLGQCVAAAHGSQNLRIPFDCLRADMTGTPTSDTSCPKGTGSTKMSLGKAIQSLGPNANHTAAATKGQKQADQDIKDSSKNS